MHFMKHKCANCLKPAVFGYYGRFYCHPLGCIGYGKRGTRNSSRSAKLIAEHIEWLSHQHEIDYEKDFSQSQIWAWSRAHRIRKRGRKVRTNLNEWRVEQKRKASIPEAFVAA